MEPIHTGMGESGREDRDNKDKAHEISCLHGREVRTTRTRTTVLEDSRQNQHFNWFGDPAVKSIIGVLDIYGFESFKINSMFPKSTHETFAQKLYQTVHISVLACFKLARTVSTINHYAEMLFYQADLFLDKNKDYTGG
ncbi:hypothetical protein HPP92_023247 [Vanilla planifolia]|uniref:Myosin motor domain-containing protein n=1 Tax=Vanilla planifolia TaxID=51239 RepID=A0A835UCY4_VANPL|nr:hypothetical protein HPP92_023551 [Vanilla planifolia]KAG0460119.1 hypothetical protein HPP92_023247 [Vanilla planifolia]